MSEIIPLSIRISRSRSGAGQLYLGPVLRVEFTFKKSRSFEAAKITHGLLNESWVILTESYELIEVILGALRD